MFTLLLQITPHTHCAGFGPRPVGLFGLICSGPPFIIDTMNGIFTSAFDCPLR